MKAVATDLKAIYSASTESEAEFNVELFAEKWDALYPSISKSWRAHWARVIPLFAFPEYIRKVIYTTNAIESVNMTLRQVTRNHRIFPSDEAVYKVVYLAMRNLAKKWTMPICMCQIKSYTENKDLHQKRWRSLIILNGRQLVIDTEVVGSHNKVAN